MFLSCVSVICPVVPLDSRTVWTPWSANFKHWLVTRISGIPPYFCSRSGLIFVNDRCCHLSQTWINSMFARHSPGLWLLSCLILLLAFPLDQTFHGLIIWLSGLLPGLIILSSIGLSLGLSSTAHWQLFELNKDCIKHLSDFGSFITRSLTVCAWHNVEL